MYLDITCIMFTYYYHIDLEVCIVSGVHVDCTWNVLHSITP